MSGRIEVKARSFAAYCGCGACLIRIGAPSSKIAAVRDRAVAREDVMTCGKCGTKSTIGRDEEGELCLEGVDS